MCHELLGRDSKAGTAGGAIHHLVFLLSGAASLCSPHTNAASLGFAFPGTRWCLGRAQAWLGLLTQVLSGKIQAQGHWAHHSWEHH